MSIKNYLKDLARDIVLLENNRDFRAAKVLHDKFIRVANFPNRKDELMDDSFLNADRYEEDMDLYDQANEDYYGEMKDNPDEDIVDDSLGSDMYDHDVNEFKNDTSSNAMNLINSLREELQHNDLALKIIDILEEELD